MAEGGGHSILALLVARLTSGTQDVEKPLISVQICSFQATKGCRMMYVE